MFIILVSQDTSSSPRGQLDLGFMMIEAYKSLRCSFRKMYKIMMIPSKTLANTFGEPWNLSLSSHIKYVAELNTCYLKYSYLYPKSLPKNSRKTHLLL